MGRDPRRGAPQRLPRVLRRGAGAHADRRDEGSAAAAHRARELFWRQASLRDFGGPGLWRPGLWGAGLWGAGLWGSGALGTRTLETGTLETGTLETGTLGTETLQTGALEPRPFSPQRIALPLFLTPASPLTCHNPNSPPIDRRQCFRQELHL